MSFISSSGITDTPVDPDGPEGVLIDPLTEIGGQPIAVNQIIVGDGSGGWGYSTLAGLNFRGTWSGVTQYFLNDVVTFGDSSYIALQTNTNQTPPNATYWQLLAGPSTTADGLVFTVRKGSVGTLNKGEAIYISGYDGGAFRTQAELALATGESTMPCIGLIESPATDTGDGQVKFNGRLDGINTSLWPAGTDLYVSATTPGALTDVRPTGATNLVQKVAEVVVQDAVNGAVEVFGAGRANALPNIANGNVWVGDGSDVPQSTPFAATQGEVDAGTILTAAVTPGTLAATPRLPSQDENDALLGTNGVPSNANRYVTNTDPRVPTQDENDALVGTSGVPAAANPYVTTVDPRVPTQDENDALVGTAGAPAAANPYVTDADTRIPTQGENDALVGTVGAPGAANRYVTETDPILNVNRFMIEFGTDAGVPGGAGVRYLDRAGTPVSAAPVLLHAESSLIGITITADSSPGATREYEARVIADPGGADTLLGSLLLTSAATEASRRDLSATIGAGVKWGVVLIRTAGGGASGFSDVRVEVEVEMP